MLELAVEAEIVHWRGPAPHVFARLPADAVEAIGRVAPAVSYGWGMVPVTATIGDTMFSTALYPKDGGYLLPLKVAVRRAMTVGPGETVFVRLVIASPEA